jgi:16S rRNA (cytosine1402-N4)-methyltransferase
MRPRRPKGQRSTREGEHVPVMLAEVLDVLNPQPGQTVVDCTLGFGGHAVELLKRIGPTGKLVALDLDPDNLARAMPKLEAVGHPFVAVHANFAGLAGVLATHGVTQIHGLLADLGMSSMQVDDPARGFSFLRDGPLDMRMDRSRGKTAAELLNTLPQSDLAAAFRDLGDEPEAEAIAAAIAAERTKVPFERTSQLRAVVERAAPVKVVRSPGQGPARKQQLLPATRVFQALRILVNRELANLQSLLRTLPAVLAPGGVAAIISFHSGEDRLVKAAFREGIQTGVYTAAADDPVRPSEAEKSANPRSRSAKVRWCRRA